MFHALQLLGVSFTEYEHKEQITFHTEKFLNMSCNEDKLTDGCFAAISFTCTIVSLCQYFAI